MDAGPELDAEIARKVLGIIVLLDTDTGEYRCKDVQLGKFVTVPRYSQDTLVSHKLVQHYKNHGCVFSISSKDDGTWQVDMTHSQIQGVVISYNGTTLAHAICNAILQFDRLFKVTKR